MTLFTTHYPIYIGDTDAGGIVYHANHLNFLERCRRDWLKNLGFTSYFLDDGIHFVVKSAHLDYRHALFLDDIISVTIDNLKINPASVIVQQSIYRKAESKPATTATVTLACIKKADNKLVPCRIPPQAINKLD